VIAGQSPASRGANYYERDRSTFLDWVGGTHARVLDVGCASGVNAGWFRRHGASEIVGVESDLHSADRAAKVLDTVVHGPIETAVDELSGRFDLIVCADVLEHLADPWTVVERLAAFASPSTVLAVSMPNIRFVGALWRVAFGRGFEYEPGGIFDISHLRFFTRSNARQLIETGGWRVERWGGQHYGPLTGVRRRLGLATRGFTDQWLAEQLFAAARPAGPGRSDGPPTSQPGH
jgi:2-polyprenyl-3-methyl-5-hydroxy-6-metoxy-1,4-benzoquinol methylase